MSAHQDVHSTLFQPRQDLPSVLGGGAASQQLRYDAALAWHCTPWNNFQQVNQTLVVLVGQDLGRSHEGGLHAVAHGHDHRQKCHRRFATAHVTLQETHHGHSLGHVVNDVLKGTILCACELERQLLANRHHEGGIRCLTWCYLLSLLRHPGECSFEQQCQLQQHQLIEGQPLSGPLLPRHAHWAVDLPDCLVPFHQIQLLADIRRHDVHVPFVQILQLQERLVQQEGHVGWCKRRLGSIHRHDLLPSLQHCWVEVRKRLNSVVPGHFPGPCASWAPETPVHHHLLSFSELCICAFQLVDGKGRVDLKGDSLRGPAHAWPHGPPFHDVVFNRPLVQAWIEGGNRLLRLTPHHELNRQHAPIHLGGGHDMADPEQERILLPGAELVGIVGPGVLLQELPNRRHQYLSQLLPELRQELAIFCLQMVQM
mmetsp:Transcript_18210/g.54731  ORF Transcript_18210/g.54731 Transcript_18210/m.54731 type:complete len:426 (+) Transcript_18210:662-1939(+)